MRGYWDKRIGGESIFAVIIVFLAIWGCYKVNGVVYVLYPLKGDILDQLIIVQSGARGVNLLPRCVVNWIGNQGTTELPPPSPGVATCRSSCHATSGYTISIECKLQRYTGTSWSTVKTWTTSANRYASISQTWTVPSGYTYRVYSTFRIYNSSGTLLETGTNSKSYAYPQN